jgi:dihydrofolate reductase
VEQLDDVVSAVSKLKQQLAGDMVLDLADELRLMIFPVVLGTGTRLFGEATDNSTLPRIGNPTVESDLAYLTYQPARNA